MDWQYPEFLYLILPLTVAWLMLALYSDRRRHRAREAFVAQAMWSRILPEESRLRFWTKLGLTEFAIVMGLMAMAGPRYGTQYEDVVARGSDLYVLIDVSRSMLADDVSPTRMGRAKADVSALVNQLEGERVGLIAFAGQAVVKCPLTVDYDSFRRALDELDPDSAPRGGTAIGDAIRKALEVFHAQADRDQAILLITDGDDQQSYPLEAAAIAAERHVAVFAVGLGDSNQGARIPQKANDKTFLEYNGEQVWSKLDSHLLEEIALKTSGVYVPAGTRAYDLGELYAQHLRGRQANDAASQKRIRRSEQFQIFLALALAALLLDLCITTDRSKPMPASPDRSIEPKSNSEHQTPGSRRMSENAVIPLALMLAALVGVCSEVSAAEPRVEVREGIRLYSQEEYDSARVKFATAAEELDKQKSAEAAIAAFDEACACHRKGDFAQARDAYLRAGLSQNRALAINAHFNLGNLDAEQARQLAGEKPETVAPDKRKEILDHLTQAIAAYRHCLELNREHAASRRNLELVRQWIKFYSDKWSEQDRQKRRDESNLIVFLEYLIQTQSALRETVNHLPTPARPDSLAELKRLQDELHEEIPTLREKIANDLRPKPAPGQAAPGKTSSGQAAPTADTKQLDEAIALLQGWADAAGSRMSVASTKLQAKEPASAAPEQQAAMDELDKIWDAVIPFHPLLAKELSDQTAIAGELAPPPPPAESEQKPPTDDKQTGNPAALPAAPKTDETSQKEETAKGDDKQNLTPDDKTTPPTPGSTPAQPQVLDETVQDLSRLTENQEKAIRKTRLLAPKAEAELKRLESAPPAPPAVPPANEKSKEEKSGPQPVDPEQVKAGFRKAIELAPKAVEQMEAAVASMKQQDRKTAGARAEEARKILEEIQKAQPKNDQQQNEDKKDDQKKDDPQKDQEKKDDEQKQQDQKKDEKKNEDKQDKDPKSDEQKKKDEEKKKDEQKKNDEKKQNDQKKDQDKKEQPQPQPGKVSKDRIEEALRAVRERQQAKRERDRKLKGQVIGRSPVDKDW